VQKKQLGMRLCRKGQFKIKIRKLRFKRRKRIVRGVPGLIRRIKGVHKAVPSMAVAFYAIIPTLNLMLVRINPSYEGLMAKMYVFGSVLVILIALLHKQKRINTVPLVLLFSILTAYLLTPDYGDKIELTTPYLLMFTLIPLAIPQFIKVDARILSLFAMVVPSFGVLFPTKLFVLNSENVIGMDFTYSLLIPVIATIIYVVQYRDKDSWGWKLFSIPFILANSIYLFYMLLFGSRAPSMSVLLCLLFLFICHVDKHARGIRLNRKRLLWLLLFFLVIGLTFITIVNALSVVLSNNGIDSGSLEKLSRLSSEGDLSNGRRGIVNNVLGKFWESPLIGYGLASSPYVIDDSYPHNFILQFLLDGGILLTTIVLAPMCFYLYKWSKRCNMNDFSIICLFFFSSVIGALFSLDVWMNARLWLFFGFLFSRFMSYNRFPLRVKRKKPLPVKQICIERDGTYIGNDVDLQRREVFAHTAR